MWSSLSRGIKDNFIIFYSSHHFFRRPYPQILLAARMGRSLPPSWEGNVHRATALRPFDQEGLSFPSLIYSPPPTPDSAGLEIWLLFNLLASPHIRETVEIAFTMPEYFLSLKIMAYTYQVGHKHVYFSIWGSETHPSLQIPFKYAGVWEWISHTSG